MKNAVYEALNNAHENGWSFKGCTITHIAGDLASYDADLEQYEPDQLEPIVIQWYQENDVGYKPLGNGARCKK